MKYSEWKMLSEETTVYVLTSRDGQERILFYRSPLTKDRIVRRQIKVRDTWRNARGFTGNELAVQIGGTITTAEKGNRKYMEYLEKGYKKSTVRLSDI